MRRNRTETVMDDQTPAWDVPSTDWGNGWYQEILPVVGKDHLTGLYRGSDHGSTRRGPKIRSIELRLYHSQQDQSYRLPQSVPETIWHIATWGKVQAGNEHNQVSEIVYRNIRGLPLQKRSVRSTKTAVTADGLQKISWRDILRFLSESQNKRLLLSSALSEEC